MDGIEPSAVPSGTGCGDCDSADPQGWWFHLRRCAQCGHIGCCDSSPARHASAHAKAAGHPIIRSFEPGEDWFWDYTDEAMYDGGPPLADPQHHPVDQPAPGPAHRVPSNWTKLLN